MSKICISGLVELGIYNGCTESGETIKILLVGDSHTYDYKTSSKNIITAEDFISKELENNSDLKDIFIELPYSERFNKPKLIPLTNYMANIQRKYMNCFNWGISNDKNYIRAHYTDLRRNQSWNSELEELSNVVNIEYYKSIGMHNISKLHEFLEKLRTDNNLHTRLSTILGSKAQTIEYVISVINSTKIPKQINSMYCEAWKTELLKLSECWINNTIKNEQINWKWLLWSNILETLQDENLLCKNIEEIYYALTAYFGLFMDIYTIARMFRNFANTPNMYCSKPVNIVVYAGSFHTSRVAQFLKAIGFKKIVELQECFNNENCIKLDVKYLPIF